MASKTPDKTDPEREGSGSVSGAGENREGGSWAPGVGLGQVPSGRIRPRTLGNRTGACAWQYSRRLYIDNLVVHSRCSQTRPCSYARDGRMPPRSCCPLSVSAMKASSLSRYPYKRRLVEFCFTLRREFIKSLQFSTNGGLSMVARFA